MKIKICSIADVHCEKIDIEPVDILTVSGDLTMRGQLKELAAFRDWLKVQPAKHKIVIAGNHDFCLEDAHMLQEAESYLGGDGIVYLRDNAVTVEGLKIYGSPWQPWFYNWAFNLNRGKEIAQRWELIPNDIDILLVHGPPHGYGDTTLRGERVGCQDLLEAIKRTKPKYVCYGHIHEDTGVWDLEGTTLINCSVGYSVGWHDIKERKPYYFEVER